MNPAREFPTSSAALVLEPGTRVIGDLHLDPIGEARIAAFAAWCAALRDCPRLIILGDLFDVWVGPAQARLEGSRAVLEALAQLAARGVELEVVPGNRDFLMGPDFERAAGARLWPGGFAAQWPAGGERVLFVHGDELCTLDLPYQRMKRVLRSGPARFLAPRLPLAFARWAAARLRKRSRLAVARKRPEATEIQASACRALAAAARGSTLVCGHAHQFRDERLPDGPRWIVLDAWGGRRDVLRADSGGEWVPEASGS